MTILRTRKTVKRTPTKKRCTLEHVEIEKSTQTATIDTNRIVGQNEKRSLILAYAAKRDTSRDPVHVLSLWAGVIITFAVIVGCWAWAFAPSLDAAFKQPMDQESLEIVGQVKQIGSVKTESGEDLASTLKQTVSALQELADEAEKQKLTLDHMASSINQDNSTNTKNIFQPGMETASSTTNINKQ